VLNSKCYLATIEDWCSFDAIDKDKIQLINSLIKQTNAVVVISSSWRLVQDIEDLTYELKNRGFDGKVIGCTPSLATKRGLEIQAWLDECKDKVKSFVILDDESDMVHLKQFLVQTDHNVGITEDDIKSAVDLLNKENV